MPATNTFRRRKKQGFQKCNYFRGCLKDYSDDLRKMVKYTFLLLLVFLGSSDEYVRAFLSSSKPVILSAMTTMMSPLITTTLRSMVNNNAATESKVTFLALTREDGKNEKLRLQLEKNCDNTTNRTVEVDNKCCAGGCNNEACSREGREWG